MEYMAKYRLAPLSFVINRILELIKGENSFLYQRVNETQIGMGGYSLGGLPTIGKIGARPDQKFKDVRLKAALLFSGAVYHFENTVNKYSFYAYERR